MSIRKKMAEGAIWALLEKLGSQVVSFAVFTIIARFVGPEEYGLVSLCYIYLALAYALFSSIVDGVINLHIHDDLRLSTLFWGVVGSSLILSGMCFLCATQFAALMSEPRLVSMLRWFSVLPFLFALASVPTVLVTHSMNFRVFTIRTIVATSISGVIGIIMAIKGMGAYAIVAQQITLYVVINIVIWPGCGWHPRFMFSFRELANIIKPGIKMSGSIFVMFVEQQIPRLFIGRYLGPAAVGHFAFITRIGQSLQEVLIYPLSLVSYPAFTGLLNNAGEQKKTLSLLIGISGTIVFPIITWAIATASIYIPLCFGEKWVPTVPILQVFLITTACLSLLIILRDLFRAHNHMGSYLRMQTAITAVGLCISLLLVPYGLLLMTSGLVVAALLSMPLYVWLAGKRMHITLWHDYARLFIPVAASIIMEIFLYAFNNSAYHPASPWVHLLADTVLGMLVYVSIYAASQFDQMMLFIRFMQNAMSRFIDRSQQAEMMEEEIRPFT